MILNKPGLFLEVEPTTRYVLVTNLQQQTQSCSCKLRASKGLVDLTGRKAGQRGNILPPVATYLKNICLLRKKTNVCSPPKKI